jgi:hypothetical protein
MRLFTLASLVVASALVGLVTFSPGLAEAAPAAPSGAVTRVAKRAAAGATAAPLRVLPAPLSRPDVLPPLPPVARDVTAITSVTSASIGDGAPASLPALPAAEPSGGAVGTTTSAAPPARDVAQELHGEGGAHEVSPSGFVLSLGSGALVPTSTFITGLRPLGPGVAFEARLGYYPTSHLGILTGIRASYGHAISGCAGCDGGYSTQVPVMIQLAATDRTRGFYAEVGVGLATTYAGTIGGGTTYSFSSPVEGKLGFGYRVAGGRGAALATTADFNVGADVGSIDTAEVKTKTGGVLTDKSDQPAHAVIAMSLRLHFSL